MSLKTYLFIIVSLVATALFLAFNKKQSVKINEHEIIEIGTSPDYPPFAFIDEKTNEIVGFDVDVAFEIAHRLEKKAIIKRMPFKSLIFGLLAEDIDIIAAGISPTKQRRKAVSFSRPYLEGDPLVALFNKNISINSFEGLVKKSIVVNMGYTADLFLSRVPNAQITKLSTPAEAIMALQSGSVDAFVCAKSSVAKMLKRESLRQLKKFVIPNTGDSYALAINKQKPKFKEKVDAALRKMKKDGTLKKLEKKWGLS